jgi:hypothetical protein
VHSRRRRPSRGKRDDGGTRKGTGSDRDHPLKWDPSFCERKVKKPEIGFYRGLARFTSGFLKYDSELVGEGLKEIWVNGL